MIRNIIIKGERCSGTNYLQNLILSNTYLHICGHHLSISPTYELASVWKHGFFDQSHVPFNNEETLFLVIHRNVYDWLRSLYQNPWHLPVRDSFYDFITGPVCCDDCEYYDHPKPEYLNGERYCGDIIDMGHIKLQNWMVNFKNFRLIDYDRLAAHPHGIIDILHSHGVTTKSEFTNWDKYKSSDEYYHKKEYVPFSGEELLYINSKINQDFLKMITQYDYPQTP